MGIFPSMQIVKKEYSIQLNCMPILSVPSAVLFRPRSGKKNVGPDLGTLMVVLKELFEKLDFESNSRQLKACKIAQ